MSEQRGGRRAARRGVATLACVLCATGLLACSECKPVVQPSEPIVLAAGAEVSYLDLQAPPANAFARTEPMRLDDFAGRCLFEVEYAPNAPADAPAPYQTALRATHPDATRYIQIVEIDIAPSSPPPRGTLGHHLIEGEVPWTFCDTSNGNRDAGIPFYWDEEIASHREFFDNPAWSPPPPEEQPDGVRTWTASLFAVTFTERTIDPVAGVRWGYRWSVGALAPEGIALALLGPEDWARAVALLEPHYTDWEFASAKE